MGILSQSGRGRVSERLSKGGFSFFSQEGWKNCRWDASHMQYAILDASGEHEMTN